MTPREFDCYFTGAMKSSDDIQRQEWECMRYHVFMMINSKLKRSKQYRKPQNLIRFPWEKKSKPKKLNKEQLEFIKEWPRRKLT